MRQPLSYAAKTQRPPTTTFRDDLGALCPRSPTRSPSLPDPSQAFRSSALTTALRSTRRTKRPHTRAPHYPTHWLARWPAHLSAWLAASHIQSLKMLCTHPELPQRETAASSDGHASARLTASSARQSETNRIC